MSKKEFLYQHNGKEYTVVLTRKNMRSTRYYYKDDVFKVSAPYFFVTQKQIMEGLDKFADKLIKADAREKASGDDFIYVLGHRIPISDCGEIRFTDDSVLTYKNRDELLKKLKKWFLRYITYRNKYYEKEMEISKPYNVKVRKMTTRYGSNSSATHSITYSLILMHYSEEIIDSVVVHELAHDRVRDHSKKFYDVVYKYFPDYKTNHTKLRKGEFL